MNIPEWGSRKVEGILLSLDRDIRDNHMMVTKIIKKMINNLSVGE